MMMRNKNGAGKGVCSKKYSVRVPFLKRWGLAITRSFPKCGVEELSSIFLSVMIDK